MLFRSNRSAFTLETIHKLNTISKEINPNIKIIAGGGQIQNLANLMIKNSNSLGIDYLMYGYGENMILDFVENIRKNAMIKFSNIINNSTKIINYDIKASLHDFRFTKQNWHKDDIVVSGESLPLETARGCIFRCKFCSYPILGKNKHDLSYIRYEGNLIDEVLYNYEYYKTLNYLIMDDTFNERTDKIGRAHV